MSVRSPEGRGTGRGGGGSDDGGERTLYNIFDTFIY